MADLRVEIQEGHAAFAPGDKISGVFHWKLDRPAKWIALRLFWQTRGKGDEDQKIVDQVTVANPPARGEKTFSMTAPQTPYSFSGRLISLCWGLELTPDKLKQRPCLVDLTIGPHGRETLLQGLPKEKGKGLMALFKRS